MQIYDTDGNLLAGEIDYAKGYMTTQQRLVKHHEATPERSHLEVLPGTDGLRHKVVDTPARPAWDEHENVGIYHEYSAEELAQRNAPSLGQQLEANAAAIEELAAMIAGGEVG